MSRYQSIREFFQELTEHFKTSIFSDCELDIPSQIDDWEDTETRLVKITTSSLEWLKFLDQFLGPGLVPPRGTSSPRILTQWKVQRNNRNRLRFKNIMDDSPNNLFLRGTKEKEYHWWVVPRLLIRFDERGQNWFHHSIWNIYQKEPKKIDIMAYETDKMRSLTDADLSLFYWQNPQLEDLVQNSQILFLVPEFSTMKVVKPATIVLCILDEIWRTRYAKESVSLAWSLSISTIA